MTVVQMISTGLTAADVSSVMAFGYKLLHERLSGASIPVVCDDGERMVAILNASNDDILFAFGRNGDGYYAFDWDGFPVAERCRSIGEVLFAFDCFAARRHKIARRNGDAVFDAT